jgi:hypothetical protein
MVMFECWEAKTASQHLVTLYISYGCMSIAGGKNPAVFSFRQPLIRAAAPRT